jgi:hypothetical protein
MEQKCIRNKSRTTVEIRRSTRDFLESIGRKNESYDKLVTRLAQTAIGCEKNHRTRTQSDNKTNE